MNSNHKQIILFDGVCNLCNGLVQFIVKRDTKAKFKFASLQSRTGQSLLLKFGLPTDDLDSFIYIKDGNCFTKSTAGLNVLKDLGGLWWLFYAFILIPKFIRDFVYSVIAKKRYKFFGKRDSCIMPTPEIKQRFLE
ncbi:MAG: thiol-disulfide oxidoreductase DCC family protein [Bacteroidetes bacterium]|nr:thiol-disulfide oxidoreductase DCC family protein [Bacteroidota bacterium]